MSAEAGPLRDPNMFSCSVQETRKRILKCVVNDGALLAGGNLLAGDDCWQDRCLYVAVQDIELS